MTDVVKDAKVVGVLIIIGFILQLLSLGIILLLGNPFIILLTLVLLAVQVAAGVGLIMGHKWGVYLFGLTLVLNLPSYIYRFSINQMPSAIELIFTAIFWGVFIWFFINRQKFK